MREYVQKLQKLRIMTSFYRNQVFFFISGGTTEEQLGFGFHMRCKTIADGVDPTQKALVAILQEDNMPLQKRLQAIMSRLQELLDEVNAGATDEEQSSYRKLAETISIDISEMQYLLAEFVPETED